MLCRGHLILRKKTSSISRYSTNIYIIYTLNIYIVNKSILSSYLPHFVVSLHLIMNQVQSDNLAFKDANKYLKIKLVVAGKYSSQGMIADTSYTGEWEKVGKVIKNMG